MYIYIYICVCVCVCVCLLGKWFLEVRAIDGFTLILPNSKQRDLQTGIEIIRRKDLKRTSFVWREQKSIE